MVTQPQPQNNQSELNTNLNFLIFHYTLPHSHQGIIILRVLHEFAWSKLRHSTAHDQRQVVETFVNEVLTRNAARAIQGLGPLVYKPCKDMWEEVWGYTMATATKRY